MNLLIMQRNVGMQNLYSERFGWIECVGIADRSAYDLNAHIESSGTDMYAQRKYDEPKIVELKKIVPKMDVLGPLFKDKAGKIKAILEKMEVKRIKKYISHRRWGNNKDSRKMLRNSTNKGKDNW